MPCNAGGKQAEEPQQADFKIVKGDMKNVVQPGDKREHRYTVTEADKAAFASGTVHEVCSTFALAREMEWSSRLFVLDMLEEGEEGIGTRLEIQHLSPALPGEELLIVATVHEWQEGELLCDIEVYAGKRLVAKGLTGQKILTKEKLTALFNKLKNNG